MVESFKEWAVALSFRPLLTRIISYLYKHEKQEREIKNRLEFPSPFNEDHFISRDINKKERIKMEIVSVPF